MERIDHSTRHKEEREGIEEGGAGSVVSSSGSSSSSGMPFRMSSSSEMQVGELSGMGGGGGSSEPDLRFRPLVFFFSADDGGVIV